MAMYLSQIKLTNFRSFKKNSFDLNPSLTIIHGKNSVGKTNLLEAIFVAIKARGFREKNEEELLSEGEKTCDIISTFQSNQMQGRIHLSLTDTVTKTCFIDRTKKRTFDYINQTPPLVTFSPSFIYVIDGDLSERRTYIDSIISLIDKEYKKRLTNYESSLRRRNKIIEKTHNPHQLREELSFWDTYLIEQAIYIVKKRKEFVDFLNANPHIDTKKFTINYIQNEISFETLAKTFEKQFLVKRTLVGPQRDTYEISIEHETMKNVHKYGSRSEQRLALFWLVINELKLYEENLKQKPIILLDDIFSELDLENKSLVLKLITHYQTVVTTTEKEIAEMADVESSVIEL